MRALLPIDIHDRGDELIAAATTWGQRLGASGESVLIDLVYVDQTAIPRPEVSEAHVQAVLDAQWERGRQEQLGQLEMLRDRLPPPRRGEVMLTSGPPAQAVIDLAGPYDLLLIGTHQHEGIQRLWLGSVAERIVQLSPKPVLVLPLRKA